VQKAAPDDAVIDPAFGKEGGLASSIHLAAGQFAARARYGAPRWFGEARDDIRMALEFLDFVEPVIVHADSLVGSTRQK
jgi:hypothetical protein